MPPLSRRVLLATSVSYALILLDTSIANVALPRIGQALAMPLAGLQWVMSAYTLAFASLLLTGGALGDRWGARRVYLAGLLAFTLASLVCGLAPNAALLIAARAAQGLGAALLVPAALKLIQQACPDPAQRARAIGLWVGIGGVAMAAGPLAGGALTEWLGWRSIFLLNLPLGLYGAAMAWRIPATPGTRAAVRFDLPGQATAILALAGLIGVLIEGQALGWTSAPIVAGAAVALAAGIAFLRIQARSAHAMLPLTLFSNPLFAASTAVSMVSAFVFYGLFFVASLGFQDQRHWGPLQAGLAFLPMTVSVALASVASHRIARACGPILSMCVAFGLYAAGALGLLAAGSASYGYSVPALLAIGLASGFISPAATAPALETVAPQRAGVAAAALNTARQAGAALGVAVFGSLLAALPPFAAGARAALLIAAALALGAGLAWAALVRSGRKQRPAIS